MPEMWPAAFDDHDRHRRMAQQHARTRPEGESRSGVAVAAPDDDERMCTSGVPERPGRIAAGKHDADGGAGTGAELGECRVDDLASVVAARWVGVDEDQPYRSCVERQQP
jgi:hypothetical protein